MMKKWMAVTLCTAMALSFSACSHDNLAPKDNPKQQTENVQIPNPWVDCKTIEDAEKLIGFTVILPKTIPADYAQDTIEAAKDNIVQIIYKKGEDQIIYRQAKGSEDISGDFTAYKDNSTITVGTVDIAIRGNIGKINVATWTDGEYAFAISVNPDGNGLDDQSIKDMIASINSTADGENVQIPSPFIPFETLADAEKLAGFTVTLPPEMPDGYTQKFIEAVENRMIQILLENGEDTLLIRKAKGNEDVSGDYNQYAENNTVTVEGLQIFTKGNNGKVNVATWVDGEYTYAISAGFEGAGFDAAVISDMVSAIR